MAFIKKSVDVLVCKWDWSVRALEHWAWVIVYFKCANMLKTTNYNLLKSIFCKCTNTGFGAKLKGEVREKKKEKWRARQSRPDLGTSRFWTTYEDTRTRVWLIQKFRLLTRTDFSRFANKANRNCMLKVKFTIIWRRNLVMRSFYNPFWASTKTS